MIILFCYHGNIYFKIAWNVNKLAWANLIAHISVDKLKRAAGGQSLKVAEGSRRMTLLVHYAVEIQML
jgi:hypothetical protein